VDLSNKSNTDDVLVHLQELRQLRFLFLDGAKITDAGLVHLRRLSQLQTLDVRNTKVTDQGVKKLQQALPNCKIKTK
jgi:hypothetical protein